MKYDSLCDKQGSAIDLLGSITVKAGEVLFTWDFLFWTMSHLLVILFEFNVIQRVRRSDRFNFRTEWECSIPWRITTKMSSLR